MIRFILALSFICSSTSAQAFGVGPNYVLPTFQQQGPPPTLPMMGGMTSGFSQTPGFLNANQYSLLGYNGFTPNYQMPQTPQWSQQPPPWIMAQQQQQMMMPSMGMSPSMQMMPPMGMPPMGMQMGPQYGMQGSAMGPLLAMAAPLLGSIFNGSSSGLNFNFGGAPIEEPCEGCTSIRNSGPERLPVPGSALPGRYSNRADAQTEAVAADVPATPPPRAYVPQNASVARAAQVVEAPVKPAFGDRVAMTEDADSPAPPPPIQRATVNPAPPPQVIRAATPVAQAKAPVKPKLNTVVKRPDVKVTPGQRAQVRQRTIARGNKAQGVPTLWNTLISKLAVCAPGCQPAGYNAFASHGHIKGSCHYSNRAIDIPMLKCGGKTIHGRNGGFNSIVSCLDRIESQGQRSWVLYYKSKNAKSWKTRNNHREHMHFSIGCGGGTF